MANYGIARKKASTWISALAMVAGVLAMSGGQAHAVSNYLTSFNNQYGTSGTALNTCNLCHTSVPARNPYGAAFASNGHSFTAIENLDSDGDGFTNIAEITARTFPGDPGSTPPPTDTTPPTVSSTNPVTGATAVPVGAAVTATFSEAVKSVSATTFTLKAGATPVAGTVTLSATTATFTPSAPLAYSTTYTATITTGVMDLANNALAANHVWSFTTGAAADTTPPTVSSTSPAGNEAGVPTNTAVTATFSEAMAGASLTTATFTLVDGSGNPVAGTVTSSGSTATFAPTANLANGTTYTATITTGARDIAGNGLAQSSAWSFTTVSGTSDTDGDGIPDNLDAFPDDNRKATVPNPMGGQGITIDVSSTAGARLMGIAAMADTDASLNQTGKPAGFGFGNGVIAFKIAGLAPGGSASVVLTFPASPPADAKIFKVDSGGFHEFPGAVISGNTVTLTLTD
ncbi:MAG: Ig-like domain-containing protein, partial [Deltaproteobacteria bacterium]|nr:Ig-like domain-containing protein [Deltaproteobacteria bacterium]